MRTERTRSRTVLASSPLAWAIAREIEAVGAHIAELVVSARPKVGDRRSGGGGGAPRRSRLGLHERPAPWWRATREWSARTVALRCRAGTSGTGGRREGRAATEYRTAAAPARTAATGGGTRRCPPHSRQIRTVIADRAILRSSRGSPPRPAARQRRLDPMQALGPCTGRH